jgi:tetratricopeptide (TPR) repeat protein
VSALSWIAATGCVCAATFDDLAAAAATARRNNQIPEAAELYRQAVAANADWTEGWWFLGTLSYALYRYPDCESAFTQFVKHDENRALGWALLGLCEFETGNYDHALAHIERGLAPGSQLPPEVDAGVRFHHGLLLTRAGLFDQGRRELEHFARAGAAEPMLLAGIGLNALRIAGLPKDIPAERREMIVAAGEATCAWILGDTAKADRTFSELVKQYPAAHGIHFLYGTYVNSVRPDEAPAEFRRELELNPENTGARAMLALFTMQSDATAALADAKRAALEKPSDPLADYAYGKVLVTTGALTPGIGLLEAAERLDPAALEYHIALAAAYSKAGRNNDARRERKMSIAIAKGHDGAD